MDELLDIVLLRLGVELLDLLYVLLLDVGEVLRTALEFPLALLLMLPLLRLAGLL